MAHRGQVAAFGRQSGSFHVDAGALPLCRCVHPGGHLPSGKLT